MTASAPKVVATDLDGTLLRSDGSVSPRTRSALWRAEQAGATVIFVSARPPRWIDVLADEVGEHGLAICANGALVYDVTRRAVIEQHPLAGDVALQIARAIQAAVPGVRFAIERQLSFGREPTFRVVERPPAGTLEGDLDVLLVEPVAKLLAQHEELDPADFIARATAAVGELALATHSGSDALLEISALGVSKASTLARLCAERGVAPEEVVAFGDMPNDIPMLSWAGLSYAVANAHPDVVAVADRRCAGNDDDGVAQVLEQLFV